VADADPVLAGLVERNGVPPLWAREPGFATMLRLILEQQVSLASADAAFRKLEATTGIVEPATVLALDDDQLKMVGFSRQKAGYARSLAAGLTDGSIDLDSLGAVPDEPAVERLLSIRGVGPWTASCYLLFALRRPDAWPPGDRALQVSMCRAYDLPDVPDAGAADERAMAWRPHRAIAARLLWHEYLGGRS
jgi:DNA-3-methyladenine glycosylase II